MRRLSLVLLIAGLHVALLGSISRALEVETAVGVTQLNPAGNISYKGISLDLKNDLRYDKVQTFTGRLKLDLPLMLPNLYFSVTPLRFSETGSKDVTFVFGGTTFTGSVPFSSSLRLDHYDTTLFYGIPFLETVTDKKLKAQIGLNIRVIDFKAEISQVSTGLNESKSLFIPVPMAYLFLQVSPIEKLKISGEFKGFSYSSNRYYDITTMAKWELLKFFFLGAGYKYQNIAVDQSDIKTQLEFGGPAAELGFLF